MSLFSFCENVNVFSLKFLYGIFVHCNFRKEKNKMLLETKLFTSGYIIMVISVEFSYFRLVKNCEVMINRIFELIIILIVY